MDKNVGLWLFSTIGTRQIKRKYFSVQKAIPGPIFIIDIEVKSEFNHYKVNAGGGLQICAPLSINML